MTYEEILTILKDTTRTDYQRAADIHAALTRASQPSALNIKPQVPRKPRTPNKPKGSTLSPIDKAPPVNGSGEYEVGQ